MPESKGRFRPKARVPEDPAAPKIVGPSPRWLAPLMVTLFLLGLLWIVISYLVPDLPLIEALGSWNMLIGFVLIMGGFVVSTRWR